MSLSDKHHLDSITFSVIHNGFQSRYPDVHEMPILSIGFEKRRITWHMSVLLKHPYGSQATSEKKGNYFL
ncbi:hypothetical protein I79_025883 [Cricetulus griseus]|uniref:Uncharacterized protein n=1 Tax=Cricetulus griseus TaxID=10029 RepID=G3IPH2_CRIGR|nr:hypothetical protein I79_025883 [Cricetulus griseus]